MAEEAFNLTSFCEAAGDDSSLAACAARDAAAASVEDVQTGLNRFFLIFGGTMVFFMQAGFAMLCAGSVRQKNVKNILLKNLLDACGGALGFFFVGYGIAYGGAQDGLTFIGNGNFALRGFDVDDGDDWAFFFFQFAFAATAATIVAGTVAERCKMAAYLCYSVFLTGFVYPVIAHSIWDDNGFLSAFAASEDLYRGTGVIDFAGSGVVHMTGGLTALIAAIILGPRRGRFTDDDGNPLEEPASFAPHSVALQMLGTFILWVGWYGFNPGSALGIQDKAYGDVAALCAVTTTLAAAAGAVTAMFTDSIIEALRTGEASYELTMAMNGCLGGLVAITAGCCVIPPWCSIIVGAIGGLVYLFFSKLLVALKIDDAVDAIPVHFANGFWGVFAVGLFAEPGLMDRVGYNSATPGAFFGGGGELLIIELTSLGWIIGWVTVLMTPFFFALRLLGMFRVDPLEEEVGLDISHHRGAAYDLTAAKKSDVDELMETRASKHGKVEVPREVAQAAPEYPSAPAEVPMEKGIIQEEEA